MRYKEVFYDKLNKEGCFIISFWLKFYVNCCFWYILFFLGTLAWIFLLMVCIHTSLKILVTKLIVRR